MSRKRIILKIPLDLLANNKIDLIATLVLKDVQEVWVSMEEDRRTQSLTGKTKLSITQFGDLPNYYYVFNQAPDAIKLCKDIIKAVENV